MRKFLASISALLESMQGGPAKAEVVFASFAQAIAAVAQVPSPVLADLAIRMKVVLYVRLATCVTGNRGLWVEDGTCS